uniref:Endonuclease III-like protein 1 n=1 Tax=Lingulaulax polyedra TaxID=160621 RepID=A0A516AFY3_LINPO|nr:endonuclease III-like protein 1 [Lingulodinium polyedra]|mmetsp:Transcript_3672/g.11542  ORF Transcript_3672/g.11542 Transcript_3672/m.11542 type:complete len:395 (+) Transcript_3672:67-1251(+)
MTSKRPPPQSIAQGFVKLFTPATRCRAIPGTGVLAISDSDAEVEVLSDASQELRRGGEAAQPVACAASDGPVAAEPGAQGGDAGIGTGDSGGDGSKGGAVPEDDAPVAAAGADVALQASTSGGHSSAAVADTQDALSPPVSGGGDVVTIADEDGAVPGPPPCRAAGEMLPAGTGPREAPVAAREGLFEEFSFGRPSVAHELPRCQGPDTPPPAARGPQRAASDCSTPPLLGRRAGPRRPRAPQCSGRDAGQEVAAAVPEEDREQTARKWRALAGPAPSPGALRLQLLVAAIIHPKASEAVVGACMAKLRAWADGGLSAERLAAAGPQNLERLWDGLHWHKVKAGRVVAAASALEARWGGQVPTRREELITLPGIGPKLADLLAFVIETLAPVSP